MIPANGLYDLTGAPLPASTVQSIVNRQWGTVQIGARFRVVDTTLRRLPVMVKPSYWNQISPLAFDAADIAPLIAPNAQVAWDTTRPVHGQMDFTMLDPEWTSLVTLNPNTGTSGFPFDPLHCFLEVAQVLTCRGLTFEVPCGYWIAFMPQAQVKPGSRYFTWSALDLTSLVAQTPFLSDYVVYKDYPGGIIGAVMDMLAVDGIPITEPNGKGITPVGNADAGPAIPRAMMDFDLTANQPVPVDILFNAGQSRLEAINQLLQLINYWPLYVRTRPTPTGQAWCTFRSKPLPFFQLNTLPTIDWDYSPTATQSIIEAPILQDFSSQADTRICNIARFEGSTTQDNPTNGSTGVQAPAKALSSIAINRNPNSVISTVNLRTISGGPRAITRYERQDKIPTQAICDLRANLLILQGQMLPEILQFGSLHNPLHGSHDVLTCQVTNRKGEVVIPSSAQSPFIETSWTLPLKASSGARMNHSLQRIVAI